jgi:methyl-accepting chemotaxis protein
MGRISDSSETLSHEMQSLVESSGQASDQVQESISYIADVESEMGNIDREVEAIERLRVLDTSR